MRSGSKLARSYRVSPESWTCECPDHERRRAVCKHALACWVVERAYRPSPVSGLERIGSLVARVLVDTAVKTGTCSSCGGRFAGRELVELHEDNHDDLTYFHGDTLCRECAYNAAVCY